MPSDLRYDNRPFWRRHLRAILWGIAIAGVVISIVTRFKFVFLFLPLMFVPGLVTGWRDDDQGR